MGCIPVNEVIETEEYGTVFNRCVEETQETEFLYQFLFSKAFLSFHLRHSNIYFDGRKEF